MFKWCQHFGNLVALTVYRTNAILQKIEAKHC